MQTSFFDQQRVEREKARKVPGPSGRPWRLHAPSGRSRGDPASCTLTRLDAARGFVSVSKGAGCSLTRARGGGGGTEPTAPRQVRRERGARDARQLFPEQTRASEGRHGPRCPRPPRRGPLIASARCPEGEGGSAMRTRQNRRALEAPLSSHFLCFSLYSTTF